MAALRPRPPQRRFERGFLESAVKLALFSPLWHGLSGFSPRRIGPLAWRARALAPPCRPRAFVTQSITPELCGLSRCRSKPDGRKPSVPYICAMRRAVGIPLLVALCAVVTLEGRDTQLTGWSDLP